MVPMETSETWGSMVPMETSETWGGGSVSYDRLLVSPS